MSIENKTLVQRWFSEVWNEGRADAIDEMLADDAVIHGLGANLQGPAEFKRFHSAYRNAYPDVTIDVDDLVAEGDMFLQEDGHIDRLIERQLPRRRL